MTDTIHSLLQERFGYSELLPGQRDVIEHLLAGRSAAAVFPTGGGKSLCYQLPALAFEQGLTLVVSPLIALMKDQIDALERRGIEARRLDSTLPLDEYRAIMESIRRGSLRLLYVAPERLGNERFREAIKRTRIALLAVDEAHCISEWGHNFRPDYLKLAEFAREAGAERVLALTATATDAVIEDMRRAFAIDAECCVRTGVHRPNLTLLLTPTPASKRDAMLLDRFAQRERGPTIVYVTLQRTAEQVATLLAAAGLPARPYHAGLEDAERHAIQEWFMGSDDSIVVATIAFGMGVDKSNIRYVYHYNLSKSLESYSQEVGRAGRDGDPALCESFVCLDDLNMLENFAYGDTPGGLAVERLVRSLFSQQDSLQLALPRLADEHDIRVLVLRTLLTYLELDGFLQGGTPVYATYKFQPLRSSAEILEQFTGERREFLAGVLRCSRKAKTWFSIELDAAASRLGATRERIVTALDYLAEQGWLIVQASDVRLRYHVTKRPDDPAQLAEELHGRLLRRERQELERLGKMLELTTLDGCQVDSLTRYFGQPLGRPCGHCSWCLAGAAATLPPRPRAAIPIALWAQVEALKKEHSNVLDDPRALARVLCGVTSPKASRAGLSSHALFGALQDHPFADVLARAESVPSGTVHSE